MKTSKIILLLLTTFFLGSCVWENIRKPWVPHKAEKTENLEAVYTTAAPTKINAKHWDTVDFVTVNFTNEEKGELYSDGYLNMTDMYNGKGNFNPELSLKASYDEENLYILATWKDKTVNAASENLFFNGPEDPLKTDSTNGWTSQGNSDRIALSFFKDATNGDVWKWSSATNAALGYASDMQLVSGELKEDEGDYGIKRNSNETGSRVMPLYEWNGESQNVQLPDGSNAILDPAYYLLSSNKVEVPGDPVAGRKYFKKKCESCHGVDGTGEGENVYGIALNTVEFHRLSRQALHDVTINNGHDGRTYYETLNASQQIDLFAAMRSLAGFPGYYLEQPTGSAADVMAVSSVKISRLSTKNATGYTVLFIRKLDTGNADDVAISKAIGEITLGLRLSDNDNLNALVNNDLKLILK